jgi:hypothetical protein
MSSAQVLGPRDLTLSRYLINTPSSEAKTSTSCLCCQHWDCNRRERLKVLEIAYWTDLLCVKKPNERFLPTEEVLSVTFKLPPRNNATKGVHFRQWNLLMAWLARAPDSTCGTDLQLSHLQHESVVKEGIVMILRAVRVCNFMVVQFVNHGLVP